MKKYIDKLLYFFGYAPIKISHEIKYINIHRGVELDVLTNEKKISTLEIYSFRKDKELLIKMAKEKIKISFIDCIKDFVHFEEKEENGYYYIKGSVLIKKPEA